MSTHAAETSDVPVIITGVGSGSTGEQVLKALRHGRRSYQITVTNSAREAMIVAGEANRALLPRADGAGYVRALAELAESVRARFIVPGSDAELLHVVAETSRLRDYTAAIALVNNAEVIRICRDKHATASVVRRSGLRGPATVVCDSEHDGQRVVGSGALSYPVIIKPKNGGGASADVYIAQDATELRFFLSYALAAHPQAVIQEYVGTPDDEYTVGVLHAPDGTLIGSVAIRRQLSNHLTTRWRVENRTGRPELGAWLAVSSGFSQGAIVESRAVQAAAERIAAHLGSTGPLNVQGRLVGEDFVTFEINPRFSGTTSMRAMAGFNEPEALIDWHMGADPHAAVACVRPGRFIRSLVEYADFTGQEVPLKSEAPAPVSYL